MTRRVLFSLCALLVAALMSTATAAAASKAPVVKSISPLKVKVGETLTIRGKNFVPGKKKTKVFFVRVKGKGVASAAADKATRTRVTVTVPQSLNTVLAGSSARFQIRVLARRFGKWSVVRKSPVVSPAAADSGSGSSDPAADCDADGVPNSTDTDDDNDLLSDADEARLGTNTCNADSDGDGVQDGYEYQSAVDLNRTVLFGATPPIPYPAKRPYPNPLFPDANVDYDGDGLTSADEQSLWLKFGNHQFPLNYSAGMAMTVPTAAADPVVHPELEQLDMSAYRGHAFDGRLDDGERDADGDGLSNWDESHGRMQPGWWPATYDGKILGTTKETAYPVAYQGTDMLDPDTDGDGVLDGADDQDHDGLSNQFEIARPADWVTSYVSLAHSGAPSPNPYARVDPFNPCKPVYSSTCHTHPPIGYYDSTEDWAGPSPDDVGPPAGPTPGALH